MRVRTSSAWAFEKRNHSKAVSYNRVKEQLTAQGFDLPEATIKAFALFGSLPTALKELQLEWLLSIPYTERTSPAIPRAISKHISEL